MEYWDKPPTNGCEVFGSVGIPQPDLSHPRQHSELAEDARRDRAFGLETDADQSLCMVAVWKHFTFLLTVVE